MIRLLGALTMPALTIYLLVVAACTFANLELSAVDIRDWGPYWRMVYFIITFIATAVHVSTEFDTTEEPSE